MVSLDGWEGESGKKKGGQHPRGLTSRGRMNGQQSQKKEKASGRETGTMAALL